MSKVQLPVVNCAWLAEQLNNPQVVIVDCRFDLSDPQWGEGQYRHSHIPGADYLHLDQDLSAPLKRHGGRHPLPEPERFASKMASLGVDFGKTLVVAYDSSRFAFAARLWWLLRYFGHDQVAVLDGGWLAWQEGQYPVNDTLGIASQGDFIPQVRTDLIVGIETVKNYQNGPEMILVDSRDHNRYLGKVEPIDPVAGHIPGAINLPWKEVTKPSQEIRSSLVQSQRWQNYQFGSPLVVYCGSGVTACVNLLSLEIAQINNAKLYPGGWSDWCSYD
ncbi:MAG: sulfurtransferase [Spirulinaceae cyanobacterium]